LPRELPYFKWYAADAETDERFRAMSDAEVGFYLRCLNHSWLNNGLPADMKVLARILNKSTSYVERMWRSVGRCFIPDPENQERLINPRQEDEREQAVVKSDKASSSSANRVGQKIAGNIYLISRDLDGAIKIGSSKNVPLRLAQLKYKNREHLELVASYKVANMGDSEVLLHRRFADKRVRGEWYLLSHEDKRVIDALLMGDSEGDRGYHPGYHPRLRASESDSDSDSDSENNGNPNYGNPPPKNPANGPPPPEFDFPAFVTARLQAHPNKKRQQIGVQLLANKAWIHDIAAREQFAADHEAWSKTELWLWKQGANCPSFGDFVADYELSYRGQKPPAETTKTVRSKSKLEQIMEEVS
jgi:Meiotically up-regulated gene 113